MIGLDGFAEKGTPPDWDMALGKVRGFRIWTLRIPLRSTYESMMSHRHRTLTGWGKNADYFNVMVLPVLDDAYVDGQYGGYWNHRHQRGGWYEATCCGQNSLELHEPPGPDCGCGFWAYWSPESEFFYSKPWLKKNKHHNYEVIVPLVGVIEGSGPTIIGELGFRTARARITDLAMPLAEATTFVDEDPPSSRDALWVDETGFITPTWAMVPERRQEAPLLPLLYKELGIPEPLALQTIYAAIRHNLGTGMNWHENPRWLASACPPDENYGG